MGSCEEAKDSKPEETSSPPPEQQQQQTSYVYPDWAANPAMQAYYGGRMAMPQYFSSPVASGHPPPPYMWAPMQHMMPPYAAMYPHGGVYAHPGVTVAATPTHTDAPAKSSGNSDRGLIKKLKGFDGLAMSIGNANGCSAEGGNDNGVSLSGEAEGSSEGSDGNTTEGAKNGRKRSRGGSSSSSEAVKIEQSEANGGHKKAKGVNVTPETILGKTVGGIMSSDSGSDLEFKNSPNMTSAIVTMVPNTAVLQVHSNERELKRERRKQSNRESARRSRLRKQAEAEELGTKVEALTVENLKLKSEVNQLTINAANLKHQNAKLLEKLKNAQLEQATENPRPTANLLSTVEKSLGSGSVVRNDGEANSSGSGAPLRQLLDASPRADAVAAS